VGETSECLIKISLQKLWFKTGIQWSWWLTLGKLCISPPQRGGEYWKFWSNPFVFVMSGWTVVSILKSDLALQRDKSFCNLCWKKQRYSSTNGHEKNNHQDVQKTNYTCLNRINIWLHMSQSFFNICCAVATGGPGYQFSPVARNKKRWPAPRASQDPRITYVTTEDGDIKGDKKGRIP